MIQIRFSIPLKSIKEYCEKVVELSPLPGYISKRGPYIHDAIKIMVVYEFENRKFAEGLEIISKQLDAFHSIPGFALSAHILEKGKGVKEYPFNPEDQAVAKPFSQTSPTSK